MNIIGLIKTIDVNATGLHELTDEELLKTQHILLIMMRDIADVCEKNYISWSLFGGSALGAVRERGFIPWDDDIDIYMPREDYCKFRKIFKDTLSDKYELKEPGDIGYLMHYPQIYKRGAIAKGIQSDNDTKECLFIDIFPMENSFDGRVKRSLHGLECTIYLFIDSVLRMERCKDNILKYSENDFALRKQLKNRLFFARFFHFRSLEEWLKRSDKCFSKVKDKSSKYVVAPSGSKHFFGELYERKKMETYIKVPFSSEKFSLMKGYDYYLRKRYGDDYMTPPPESKKERHVYIEFDLGEQCDNK